jgi:23S rRNA pseudouridine2605 synthase
MSRPRHESRSGGPALSQTGADAVRLQKVLASAGVASRRGAEELIAAGRVTVNGRVATLGAKVDPSHDAVAVDGVGVPVGADLVYLAVNKPRGTLSAMSSTSARPCIGDLVASYGQGLHHVGRLDVDSEGLLLVTNDGPLSHRLAHPSYEVAKRYLVELEGAVPRGLGRTLRAGVDLDDGPARVDDFVLVDSTPRRALVEVELHEGRNRIVRRMFDAAGLPVRRLLRISVGPIRLGELKPGRVRHLNAGERRALYEVVGL